MSMFARLYQLLLEIARRLNLVKKLRCHTLVDLIESMTVRVCITHPHADRGVVKRYIDRDIVVLVGGLVATEVRQKIQWASGTTRRRPWSCAKVRHSG